MPAIAAPTAPTKPATPTPVGEQTPPPAPGGLKIPSMKELAGGNEPPPGGGGVSPTPQPPAPTAPTVVVTPVPPVAAVDEEPIIPTDIVTPAGKTPEQFAKERREQKQQRLSESELQIQYQQATAQLQERDAELERVKAERDRLTQERADFERLAQTREGEINQFKNTWAETNRVTYNPGQDEDVRTHDQKMKALLQERFPQTVPGAEGNPERVFAETVLNDPAEQERLHGVLAHYANARYHRNNAAIDTAVNMMAKILGANVKMEGPDSKQWTVLPRGDQTFQAIESAMAAALPHFQGKISRLQQITKDGPKFAIEAFGKRADALRINLAAGVFLPQQDIARRLQADPHDPIALFAAIAAQAPDLRTEAEAYLGRAANSLATVSDELYVPTLRGNAPEDIEAHMQEVHSHRTEISKLMQYAVVGRNSGRIIAQLIAERDAAEERAGKAARAENPGSPAGAGGAGGSTTDPDIPTKIVTAR